MLIVRADLPERCSISIPAVIDMHYAILPERRSGSKIFTRTALRRVRAPLYAD